MKIKIESAPEKVVKIILRDIRSGKLKPGDKLPNHQEMAEHYGVGRSSVREAINALVVMGMIVAIQGKGTFVKDTALEVNRPNDRSGDIFESANIYNLMEIREVLECYAVRKAAEVISDKQIAVLNEAYKRLEKSNEEAHLYLKEDMNFHMEIAQAAKNPELGHLLRAIHIKVNQKTSFILQSSSTANIGMAVSTAKNVLRFIVSGEGLRAERAMRAHLGIIKEAFFQALFDENNSSSITSYFR